jgi:hypothetical protein
MSEDVAETWGSVKDQAEPLHKLCYQKTIELSNLPGNE